MHLSPERNRFPLKPAIVFSLTLLSLSCAPDKSSRSTLVNAPAAPDYSPRLGVAVSTAARTCVAIHNPNLGPDTLVTLVALVAPQTFTQAQITGPSQSPCPVSNNVDPNLSSYDIKVTGAPIPKMVPLVAATGAANTFLTQNNSVTADLNQDNHQQYFRGCAGKDGINLTAWSGNPLVSTLVWHGFYYEPNDPGTLPHLLR